MLETSLFVIYQRKRMFQTPSLNMITASQLRAARALLGIDQRDLAAQSRTIPTDHSAHGSERRRHPRQCRLADEAGRSA